MSLSFLHLQRPSHVSCFRPRFITLHPINYFDNFCLSVFCSGACRGGAGRRGCPVFQTDFQRGLPIRPALWREPTCQHHHRKGPLWGGDASAGFPDQAAGGSDTPVTTWTLLCAQSTQFHQPRDQEQ